MPRGMAKDKTDPKSAPPTDAKSGLASRHAAYEILRSVGSGRHLDDALRLADDQPQRDRAFVRMLVTTAFRRRGQIDSILDQVLTKRPGGRSQDAIEILRLGVAQLLFLDTEPHAAVDSTVELMRGLGFDRLTGLANAVMRRVSREGGELLDRTSIDDNLPPWIRDSWCHAYGEERTRRTTELAMRPPQLDITPARDADSWARRLNGTLIDNRTVRRAFDGDPTQLDGFADGAWWIQDAAAALPASLFGALHGKRVIDLCAAPGGKTAQLIAAGAHVTAVDTSERRLRVLRRNLKRLGMDATCVQADGRKFSPAEQVDAVLIDAPCSATGTLRRRPDVLMHRTPDDVATLTGTQRELLEAASTWIKPGGCLIYATCSLQHDEGEDVIDGVVQDSRLGLTIDPVTTQEAGCFHPALTRDGTLRVVPADFAAMGGVDGFYIARLKKGQ